MEQNNNEQKQETKKYELMKPCLFYNSKLDKKKEPEKKESPPKFRRFQESPEKNDFLHRYGRNGIIKSDIINEDEILFKEHLENLKQKQSFNFESDNEKFSVFYENKEINFQEKYSSFNEIQLNEQIMKNLKRMSFDKMTPIQKYIIPFIMDKNDCLGCGQTGSGKTIAFLVPIVHQMILEGCKNEIYNTNTFTYNFYNKNLNNDANKEEIASTENPENKHKLEKNISYPICLILVPTRELAEQIFKETRKVIHKTGIIVTKLYGGAPIDSQIRELRNGSDIVIGTPGRIIEHLQRKTLCLNLVRYLIIDESDRMLDMGFESQMNDIILNKDMTPKENRCNLMLSATIPSEIISIAKKYMKENSYLITASKLDEVANASSNVNQIIEYVEDDDKIAKLHEIFQKIKGNALIFLETKKSVDELEIFLSQRNYNVVSIHGDKNQAQRQNAINLFSSGEVPILIATDVASRGLDFPNVSYVFNFDMPKCIEDYIHRIGRTGRVGNKGTAISFFNKKNSLIANDLINILKKMNQKIPEWIYEYSYSPSANYYYNSNQNNNISQNSSGYNYKYNSYKYQGRNNSSGYNNVYNYGYNYDNYYNGYKSKGGYKKNYNSYNYTGGGGYKNRGKNGY